VLGAIDLRLPFFAAGALALLNWLYGYFVLPESLPPQARRAFDWRRANPVASLRGLSRLRGVGPLVAVIGLSALAQFTLHMTWVLYTQFKFGWGPLENGGSLFAVGIMSALVQGLLMKHLLRRFSAQRLAVLSLLSSALGYLAWGLAPQGWMMIAIIFCNVLGFAATPALQSIVSNAADARDQGQTMGAVASLNSLMAVIAPVLGSALLGAASHRPQGDWLIGLPFYLCAGLQATAMVVALRHFSRARRASPAVAASEPCTTRS
jgi:DHA1 family tetracycline resistance protein-like MFS transporter